MKHETSIIRLTDSPKHHFFGFHDLTISSQASGTILALAVEQIERPPTPDDKAVICVINSDSDTPYREIATTSTYNFPQGARQQWISSTNQFIVNQRFNNSVISSIYDADTGEKLNQIDQSTHIISKDGNISYGIDYGRLHRLGGYGYVGVTDANPNESAPSNNGIYATDIRTNKTVLILSIADVVANNEKARKANSHHFFTHLSLNPSGNRIAFLHRYRLPDGGEDTCLMTVGTDGNNCRLLAQGFLSHFDWKDDQSIIIWGRKNNSISDIRNNSLMKNGLAQALLKKIKGTLRPFLNASPLMQCSFLLVTDESNPEVKKIALRILESDGHPMLNPKNRDWLIIDNYPNSLGIRDLMLYNLPTNRKIDIGNFKMSNQKPTRETIQQIEKHIKDYITVNFDAEQYAFTRSGLHCDLHPRWFADGKKVAFDSIHEGTRQIYMANVNSILKPN